MLAARHRDPRRTCAVCIVCRFQRRHLVNDRIPRLRLSTPFLHVVIEAVGRGQGLGVGLGLERVTMSQKCRTWLKASRVGGRSYDAQSATAVQRVLLRHRRWSCSYIVNGGFTGYRLLSATKRKAEHAAMM